MKSSSKIAIDLIQSTIKNSIIKIDNLVQKLFILTSNFSSGKCNYFQAYSTYMSFKTI